MRSQGAESSRSVQPQRGGAPVRPVPPTAGATWSFVYVFFTNGIPFDAPNRSEPCPFS